MINKAACNYLLSLGYKIKLDKEKICIIKNDTCVDVDNIDDIQIKNDVITYYDYKNAFKKAKTTYVLPFLNNTEESIKAINKLVDNKRILNFDDRFYKRYSNHIFLFTGSKDMNEQINKLKKYLM